MLTEGALALTVQEHGNMQSFASKLMQSLTKSAKIEVFNPSGTNLSFSVEKREFFTDTKINWESMKWMNLPTGEVIVGPVENSLNGKLVCDMAIGGIGPIKTPLEIHAKNGKAEKITCKDKEVLKGVEDTLSSDDWSNIIGEFAFGMNPKARFAQEFLEAEKMLGTIHIAFGKNSDFPGGKNTSKNHMDFMISKPTVNVTMEDGSKTSVLKDGQFKLKL
jgi:leucyl aminopeptidase (aminopeptidase T)